MKAAGFPPKAPTCTGGKKLPLFRAGVSTLGPLKTPGLPEWGSFRPLPASPGWGFAPLGSFCQALRGCWVGGPPEENARAQDPPGEEPAAQAVIFVSRKKPLPTRPPRLGVCRRLAWISGGAKGRLGLCHHKQAAKGKAWYLLSHCGASGFPLKERSIPWHQPQPAAPWQAEEGLVGGPGAPEEKGLPSYSRLLLSPAQPT